MTGIRNAIVVLSAAAVLLALFVTVLLIVPASELASTPQAPKVPPKPTEAPLTAAEQAYVARARYGEGEPVLNPRTMVPGDVGTLGTVGVLQINGDEELLALTDGTTLWISGVETGELADGRLLDTFPLVFEVVGQKHYVTTQGAGRTVMHVRPFDVWRARRLVKEQAAKQTEARKTIDQLLTDKTAAVGLLSVLSPDAAELLRSAALTKSGEITEVESVSGASMYIGTETLFIPRDGPRPRARWQGALAELRQAQLVERGKTVSLSGSTAQQRWQLTAAGYAHADKLRAQAPPMFRNPD